MNNKIPFQIADFELNSAIYGFRRVDDTPEAKDPSVPSYIQRYRIVDGWQVREPNAEIKGWAISEFDLPEYKPKRYPFLACTRLAERLGIVLSREAEEALERQWNQRFMRDHRATITEKTGIDISGKSDSKYYRDLLTWHAKQPLPPVMSNVLKDLIKHYHGKKLPSTMLSSYRKEIEQKREELRKQWDIFVKRYADYKAKYTQWYLDRPNRPASLFVLDERVRYLLGKGLTITLEQAEAIARCGKLKSKIVLRHPLTEKMVTILDINIS